MWNEKEKYAFDFEKIHYTINHYTHITHYTLHFTQIKDGANKTD